MPRILAVNPDVGKLRYVLADGDRSGQLKLLSLGDREVAASAAETVAGIRSLVAELKCERARLLLLVSRGAVDSATFQVPPATAEELPELVRNLALREIPAINDATLLDFIAYPAGADGAQTISGMSLVPEAQQLVEEVLKSSGKTTVRIPVSTHPLRRFAAADMLPDAELPAGTSAMVICVGREFAELTVVFHGLPHTSRRIRLSAGGSAAELCRFLGAEIQRTMLAVRGSAFAAIPLTQFVLTGNKELLPDLQQLLEAHFDATVQIVSVEALLAAPPEGETAAAVSAGDYSGLIAAVSEELRQLPAAVDFASPRKPVVRARFSLKLVVAVLVGLLFAGATFWTVRADFVALDEEQQRLQERLGELNELLGDTEERRQLAAYLSNWEKNRISWPDELRDLTSRIPSSPAIVIQQLSVSPAGAGSAVATFSGVATPPEQISAMENRLRDEWHSIRIPGIREQLVGRNLTAGFQATLTIRRRDISEYEFAPQNSVSVSEPGGAGK
jgi:Tfp pilus assembly PilM family ATPase